MMLTRSSCFLPGFFLTIWRSTPCWMASKPVLQCFDLKPSQKTGTTGMPISSCASRAAVSTSSPMMPVAQDVAMNTALGLCRR